MREKGQQIGATLPIAKAVPFIDLIVYTNYRRFVTCLRVNEEPSLIVTWCDVLGTEFLSEAFSPGRSTRRVRHDCLHFRSPTTYFRSVNSSGRSGNSATITEKQRLCRQRPRTCRHVIAITWPQSRLSNQRRTRASRNDDVWWVVMVTGSRRRPHSTVTNRRATRKSTFSELDWSITHALLTWKKYE